MYSIQKSDKGQRLLSLDAFRDFTIAAWVDSKYLPGSIFLIDLL